MLSHKLSEQFSNDCRKNYTIAIAAVGDWLKNLSPGFSTNEKQNPNHSKLVHVPAL